MVGLVWEGGSAPSPAMSSSAATHKDHRPILDAAELRREAKRAKAELQHACEVPVPDGAEVDEDLQDSAPEGQDVQTAPGAGSAPEGDRPTEGRAAEPSEAAPASHATRPAEEAVQGEWISEKGRCVIREDRMTSRLAYEEPLGDGSRLHGWLLKQDAGKIAAGVDDVVWEAALVMLDEGQMPWYGPSFGEEPEALGDIQVRLRPSGSLETRIRVTDEDTEWQPPVAFRRRPASDPEAAAVAEQAARGGAFVFGAGS